MTQDDRSLSDLYHEGELMRRSVMGGKYVDEVRQRSANTPSADLQDFVTLHLWGGVWSRPGLDRRSRSLLNLGILTSLRAHHELVGHTRAALTNGLSRDDITEAVIHTAGYCGVPAALSAMQVVQRTFDTIDQGLA